MALQDNYFVIKDYNKKSVFSSFLPGISGIKGVPIWSFYVNRGQCITSFGSGNKNNSIMEFYPAHQAYQRTEDMGFRTFLKVDGQVHEAFHLEETSKDMYIGKNKLTIKEINQQLGIEVTVTYTTLADEPVGGLVRTVNVRNLSSNTRKIELLDGMPEVIPYGVDLNSMKEMGQTSKAWMEVRDHKENLPKFKVRASMNDTAEVTKVEGFHYGVGFYEGETLPVIVNKDNIFGYDTSLKQPRHFIETDMEDLAQEDQIIQNELPCCFFMKQAELLPDQTLTLHEIYGISKSSQVFYDLVEKAATKNYFEDKEVRAEQLTEELTENIMTKTGHEVFDAYCQQSYLDNVLRGGYPISVGNHVFYIYSRKHGDIERDYNFFVINPEPYTQGNGNFRDINQNRRCDVAFAPFVGDKNIKYFYNCIQLNGYNPLGIEKTTFYLNDGGYQDIIKGSFTPGELYQAIAEQSLGEQAREELFQEIMSRAVENSETAFGEGYWSDHWTYNLDLIESYLSIYPEREETLLYGDRNYTYRTIEGHVLPRKERYVKTNQGVRQYNFIKEIEPATSELVDRNGDTVTATLIEKMILLCITKTAALDPYGMGIEMEGGKPGWYDALNGLPGLFGSSMAETYELARNLDYVITRCERYRLSVMLPKELESLAIGIYDEIVKHQDLWSQNEQILAFWDAVNHKKEQYWELLEQGISGQHSLVTCEQMIKILKMYQMIVQKGIEKAFILGEGIAPTYFYYEMTEYEEDQGILPKSFQVCTVPPFLEGPVKALKLKGDKTDKIEIYDNVKASGLYDNVLNMYKVNASLEEATFELGRAKSFTSGWLENESIWLHMEYKYLLELLKNGLYEQYEHDFYQAGVPFLDEDVYGRSLLENSSFIASSVNPDRKKYGKGFVARLSGSTAEFLQMWQIMMFGAQPFEYDGQLNLAFTPMLPSYLIGENKKITARFLGATDVTYYLADQESVIPGNYHVAKYKVHRKSGEWQEVTEIRGALAEEVRAGGVDQIEVYIEGEQKEK